MEDISVIWDWWNDPLTRKMMKRNDPVPWEEHCAWFEGVLKDEKRILCVGLSGEEKIGVVRFDFKAEGTYEVSINLNPEFRGKGYGPKMLLAAIDHLKKMRSIKKLFAKMKKINIPSQNAFLRAGFALVDSPECDHPGLENFASESEFYCERKF
jgi:RimJ/RimL family protein N-acetyltransferase